MKKLICSLICAVLFSSARADVESDISAILTTLESVLQYSEWNNRKLGEFAYYDWHTIPYLGPFTDFLTGQFSNYFTPLNDGLVYLASNSDTIKYAVDDIESLLYNMPSHEFGVHILSQDFTDLETYLENAVSSPLNYIYTKLQDGINVHGTVSADLDFNYSKFDDVFSYYAAATGPSRFNLAYHKRYVWASHIYDPDKPIPEVVSVQQDGGSSYDFLGFIEQYCNGQLQNMESLQAGLVQVLGALRGDDAQTEEITDDFESVESDAESQINELSKSIDFSKYNFEVSDELFRSEVFAIGDGSSQMPEFVSIGPFDLRGFGPEISTFGFSIDCREWRPFFELIRSCFTIIIYLVICTLALSICFLLWKVGAPCVRVLQNIFNF